MKKILIGILTALTTIILCLTISACTDPNNGSATDSGEFTYAGTYKFKSLTETRDGVSTTINVGDTIDGVTYSADYLVYVLKDDNTVTMTYTITDRNISYNGTWEERDSKLFLTFESELEAHYSNNTITITDESYGQTTVLVR
jgi:ABC-type oligopeptide transport system substrate-binding subunit